MVFVSVTMFYAIMLACMSAGATSTHSQWTDFICTETPKPEDVSLINIIFHRQCFP